MSDILKKLTKEMQKVQDPKRFTHTLGVEYTAAALAMRYGEDVERAQIAGLLHDCEGIWLRKASLIPRFT